MSGGNLFSLNGKRILVTGSTGGLGQVTANLLAELGASVIAAGRDTERLTRITGSLPGAGHTPLAIDLEKSEQIVPAIRGLSQGSGGLDGVVHLAGIDETKPLNVCSPDQFARLYRVNVVAAAMLLKALTLSGLGSGRRSSVVLVGSVMSVVGSPARSAYAASKSALLGLTRSAALELGRKGIRVNVVLPGYIQTNMTMKQQAILTVNQLEEIKRMHPLGLGTPEDVASSVAFLLSDAARWITGSLLTVDGGYTAH